MVVRNAYEENRVALASSGTLRFHATHGHPGPATSVEEAGRMLNADWKRLSRSTGLFIFDGPRRRYENLYPTEQEVALRTKTSRNKGFSPIFSTRLLTDGETTLKDNVDVSPEDDKTELHTPSSYTGTKVFYQNAIHLPLHLTDPAPSGADLGRCLGDLLEGREPMRLVEVNEEAKLDGIPVIKLTIESSNPRQQFIFWVDLEHGAIPLRRCCITAASEGAAAIWEQETYSDIRWVGKGWLPFHRSVALGNLTSNAAAPSVLPSDGSLSIFLVREMIVNEADFEKRPDAALFALEFPKEFNVLDSDRRLAYGRRRVWTLKDFSPDARARARPIGVASRSPQASPTMPNARDVRGWWPAVLLLLGITCVGAAGALLFQRLRRHAA